MSYSSIRDVQRQIDCFTHGNPNPKICADISKEQHTQRPVWSAIYSVNADPANPLSCDPRYQPEKAMIRE